MKLYNIRILFVFTILSLFIRCAEQQARKPISQQSGSFMKESIERNKKLNNSEESILLALMKKQPENQYISSKKGYWYFYESKSTTTDTISPKRGDIVTFEYSISDVAGNVIYSDVELKTQTYIVDKENIMMGLRDGIKLMKKGEKTTFLFPSNLGYGYFGDKNKIGPNVPLICSVSLLDIKPEKAKKSTVASKPIQEPVETKIKNDQNNPEQQIKAE